MKLRLVIIDNKKKYFDRLLAYYKSKFQDKIDLYYYSKPEEFIKSDNYKNVDILLVDDKLKDSISELRNKYAIALLVDSPSVESILNIKAIFRYQKPELIYKELLDVLAEYGDSDIVYKIGSNNDSKVDIFMSLSGGAGATSIALASAMNFANKGEKALYLNLESIEATDIFLTGNSNGTFHDLVYAIKSSKPNIGLKIESIICKDVSGVYYFKPEINVADMLELSADDKMNIITVLKGLNNYEHIIIDMDFDINENMGIIDKIANRVVFVCEDSSISLKKAENFVKTLKIFDSVGRLSIKDKAYFICNKSRRNNSEHEFIYQYLPIFQDKNPKEIVDGLRTCNILGGKVDR